MSKIARKKLFVEDCLELPATGRVIVPPDSASSMSTKVRSTLFRYM